MEYLARKFFATQGILADLYLLQVIPRPVDCEVLRGTHRDPKEYRDDYNQQYGNERNTALAMRGERPLYPGPTQRVPLRGAGVGAPVKNGRALPNPGDRQWPG